jgi:hypothetical protein
VEVSFLARIGRHAVGFDRAQGRHAAAMPSFAEGEFNTLADLRRGAKILE